MNTSKLCKLFLVLMLLLFPMVALAQENIDPDNDDARYAWGENVGWLNLEPDVDGGPGVQVSDNKLTGWIWGENVGWISLSCENTGSCDDINYGVVNDTEGNLSGYAWGENVGWINFFPTIGGGVYIDACGDFNGTAWGENIGWINFRSNGDNPFHVRTSWTSPVDDIPPLTEIVDPVQDWYNNNVSITLTATDCGSGVNEIYYNLDGSGNVSTPGSSATVSITDEGEHTLEYFSVDNVGLGETPPNVVTFSIDKTPPSITITSPSDAATYQINENVLANYDVTDLGSGVDDITSTVPNGDPIDTSTADSFTFVVSATDIAGNSNSVTYSYNVVYPGNIDPDNNGSQYAYGENVGWINFKPSFGPGVTVTDTELAGYAWGENIGWIHLNPAEGGVTNNNGILSGYAWGENIGWINFAPTEGGVKIDPVTGEFSGQAWGENVGWITFSSTGPVAYEINTSWRGLLDADGDGYNFDLDCNDNDPNINPGATEVCDGLDNDCNGIIDDGIAPIPTTCGVGECAATGEITCVNGAEVDSCTPGTPGAEVCDGLDNDCDSLIDEGVLLTFYRDADGDGYGDSANTIPDCTPPIGYVPDSTDCDDTNDSVYPGAPETCEDGIDQDCNGEDSVSPTVGPITAPVDPIPIGGAINVSADISDPNQGDTLSAVFDWGDNSTSAGILNQGLVEGSHEYTETGVYTIKLTVSDSYCDDATNEYQYIVVYDPNGGFVTGGGWIDSPENAYPADPSLTGKATFGFVSKYKKGASTPTGVTEFQFKVADLNFRSDSYDWLVIAGAKAMYKGIGTINGEGEYNFILSAIDADLNPSFEIDRFRIKIWQEALDGTETVIYDNAIDDDSEDAMTDIGGGSIVIHTKKK